MNEASNKASIEIDFKGSSITARRRQAKKLYTFMFASIPYRISEAAIVEYLAQSNNIHTIAGRANNRRNYLKRRKKLLF